MSANPELTAEPILRRDGRCGVTATFVLMCNATEEHYALTTDGQCTWTYFGSVDQALVYMGRFVHETTLLTVCNENGKAFMVVNVKPLGA